MNRDLKYLLIANYWQTFGFTILAPLYAIFVVTQTGGSEFQVGLTYSIYGISAGLLMIVFGKIEDKLRSRARTILVIGYLLLAAASLSYVLVDTVSRLIALQVFYALAVAVYVPVHKTLYSLNEDDGKESSEWALLDGGNFLVIGLASLTGGYLLSRFGFDAIFLAMAVSNLIAAGFAALVKSEGSIAAWQKS